MSWVRPKEQLCICSWSSPVSLLCPVSQSSTSMGSGSRLGMNEPCSASLLLPLLLPPPLLQARPLSLLQLEPQVYLEARTLLCKLRGGGGGICWTLEEKGFGRPEEGREAEPGHHGWILCSWAPLPVSAPGHSISSGEKPLFCVSRSRENL